MSEIELQVNWRETILAIEQYKLQAITIYDTQKAKREV
jgi:hypothetical protein